MRVDAGAGGVERAAAALLPPRVVGPPSPHDQPGRHAGQRASGLERRGGPDRAEAGRVRFGGGVSGLVREALRYLRGSRGRPGQTDAGATSRAMDLEPIHPRPGIRSESGTGESRGAGRSSALGVGQAAVVPARPLRWRRLNSVRGAPLRLRHPRRGAQSRCGDHPAWHPRPSLRIRTVAHE